METKAYENNSEITVLWTPERCIHAGKCVELLPEVYHPKDWLRPELATLAELKKQIEQCPSGALSYKFKK